MEEFDRSRYHAPLRPRSGRFAKRDRILSLGEFRRVYRRGFHASNSRFGCYVLPNRRDRSRLGLSVSRKFGGSPRRNAIKRRIREVFRFLRPDFPGHVDLVLVPRRGAHRARIGQIAEDVARLVDRALRERERRS